MVMYQPPTEMLPPAKRPKPRRPPSPYYGNYRPAPTDAELSELVEDDLHIGRRVERFLSARGGSSAT